MVNPTGLQSMTGYAHLTGTATGWDWSWELRSVNSKGLDLRLRLPEGCEALEGTVRAQAQAAVTRGSVTLTLKLEPVGGPSRLKLDPMALSSALDALAAVEAEAHQRGLSLAVPTMAEVLALRGVMDSASASTLAPEIQAAALAALPVVLADLKAMRSAEGARLRALILAQIADIDRLVKAAKTEVTTRQADMAKALRDALARVLQAADAVDEARIAQELALIAVKSDITEELDRLSAHISAARDLLNSGQPSGRKLDFLMQEFLREANTLCSKSQSTALTAIGLDLKVTIDQMREQVQNVE
jgi:uncharacterized protein (TIGR00255 family)